MYADDVILAGSGHLSASLGGAVGRAVVPCHTYIMVTQPLGRKLATAVRGPFGAFDDRFALNYFRPLPDGRLLWGGTALPRRVPALRGLTVRRQAFSRRIPSRRSRWRR